MMRFHSKLRRWKRDERGSITVELVVWMPVLAFWLVGSAAFFDAYKTRNDVAKAAHTLSDIVSRQTDVDNAFLDELYVLQGKLLPRYPVGRDLRLSSIQYFEGTDQYLVQWSRPLGGGEVLANEDVPLSILPEMADLDTVILTEVSAPYQPFTNWGSIAAREWAFELVSRPRFVSEIPKLD